MNDTKSRFLVPRNDIRLVVPLQLRLEVVMAPGLRVRGNDEWLRGSVAIEVGLSDGPWIPAFAEMTSCFAVRVMKCHVPSGL